MSGDNVTPLPQRFQEIERLRAIAILLVLIHHMPYLVEVRPRFLVGWTGVDLFFVISGFVVAHGFLRELGDIADGASLRARISAAGPRLKAFYARRAFRILPAACTAGALYFAAAIAFNTAGGFGTPGAVLAELGAFLTLQHNYYITYNDLSTGAYTIGHYWSLTVEEHFYFLLPLLLICAGTRSRRLVCAVAGIVLVALIVRPYIGPGDVPASSYYRYLSHNRFDSLLAGVVLALLLPTPIRRQHYPTYDRSWWTWSLVTIALIVAIWCVPGFLKPEVMWHFGFVAVWLMAAGLVFIASLNRNYVLGFHTVRHVLEYIGKRSYSMYLVHMLVIKGQSEAAARSSPDGLIGTLTHTIPGQFCVGIVGTLIISELMYRGIEVPFRERGRRVAAMLSRARIDRGAR